jgi:hypothetical protein|nr:MAG TPA: hypothetical protein [Caudoviricetes sp.]
MKQINKLYSFIKDPRLYGIRKNTRVYKVLCRLAVFGIVTTGYSDKNTKHVDTWDVVHVLDRLGIACGAKNVAPRGGACGERVFLQGAVKKDCLENYKNFAESFLLNHPKKNTWDVESEFIKNLQK